MQTIIKQMRETLSNNEDNQQTKTSIEQCRNTLENASTPKLCDAG